MVYQYTRPRAPIAAAFTTPGPTYTLPVLVGSKGHDPRSVHRKNPAYSFGARYGKFKDTCGPGPSHYPDPKVHRDGRDGTARYSLYSRPKDITVFSTPGPASYNIQPAASRVRSRAPVYSFGGRYQRCRRDFIPAANSYSLPGMIGVTVQSGKPQAPCYSFHSRPNIVRFIMTPGPGTYRTTDPRVYKCRAPMYSLTSRNVMPGDTTQRPGPGSHMPRTACVKARSPAYSFGIRHSDYLMPFVVDLPSFECCLCED